MQLYTWVKYADNQNGNNMSDSPLGKNFVGVAANQTSPNDSDNPSDYVWSPIK